MTGEELLSHLRDAHAAQLDDPGLITGLDDAAGAVHAAMHNDRCHPGHFHHGDAVLRLWEDSGRIDQVETGGRT